MTNIMFYVLQLVRLHYTVYKYRPQNVKESKMTHNADILVTAILYFQTLLGEIQVLFLLYILAISIIYNNTSHI